VSRCASAGRAIHASPASPRLTEPMANNLNFIN
jgi:hypothetical protein